MFDDDFEVCGSLVDAVMETATSTFGQFQAVIDLKAMCEAAEAALAAQLCTEHGWSEADEFDMDAARPCRIGADGECLVDEDLPLEIALAMGTSVGAAVWYLKDVVNLSSRHANTWKAVQKGLLPLWRGRQIAQACAELPHDAAVAVDKALEHIVGRFGWRRTTKALRAAIMKADPQHIEAQARLRSRYVRKHETDDPATRLIVASVDTGDAVFFDAQIARIAEILATQGNETSIDERRASAFGILARPDQAIAMFNNTDTPATLPTTQIYVHMHQDTLEAEAGLVRVEREGPALVSHLKAILGHSNVKLTPVIHTGVDHAVDAYEIPDKIREHVILRDDYEAFPWSSIEARHLDLDHTDEYQPGRTGQTRPSNLGPLSRRAHRAKTHNHWQLTQLRPGIYYWQTPQGQTFIVGPMGTIQLNRRC